MADFCHDYDPGGIGCPHPGPCPEPCYGDFATMVDAVRREGTGTYDSFICEGHGSLFVAAVNYSGELKIWHAPIVGKTVSELFNAGPGLKWFVDDVTKV